jgi:hypothetical protein
MPIKTLSEANQRGLSLVAGIIKSRRVRSQRSETFLHLLGTWGRRVPPLPLTITLTRVSAGTLDGDNLQHALKFCRDGVADWLALAYGKGSDEQPGLTWAYAQAKGGRGEYAVEVTITRTTAVPYAF